MPIVVNVDVMLARRKMTSAELAEKIGLSAVNLSILKTGKAKGIRFSPLDALCKALDCQPGDLLEFRESTERTPAHFSGSDQDKTPLLDQIKIKK